MTSLRLWAAVLPTLGPEWGSDSKEKLWVLPQDWSLQNILLLPPDIPRIPRKTGCCMWFTFWITLWGSVTGPEVSLCHWDRFIQRQPENTAKLKTPCVFLLSAGVMNAFWSVVWNCYLTAWFMQWIWHLLHRKRRQKEHSRREGNGSRQWWRKNI